MKPRLLACLCVLYVFLVLYGSLMPFDFVNDDATVRRNFHAAFLYWPLGQQHASRTDALANVMLYVPMGLLIATRLAGRRGRRRVSAVLAALLVGTVASVAVEGLQLLSPSRVGGINDVQSNALGALIGGVLGAMWGRRWWLGLRRRVRRQLLARPIVLGAWLTLLILFCDAIYPFRPTLDVSEVWHNVKAARAMLGAAGLQAHPWHYWLVLRIGVYAALTALLAAGSRRRGGSRWLAGACWATAFAAAIETLKFFFTARNPNYANVLMSAGGALAGLALGPALAHAISRRGKFILAACLLLVYTAYWEWRPLTFNLDREFLRDKLAAGLSWGPHWLPFYEYALGGRGENVFLFVQWLALMGSLALAVQFAAWDGRAARGKWSSVLRGALLAAAVGVAVEAVKVAVPGRIAAVTTVYCFAMGGALGGWVACRHQARILRAGRSAERDCREES